MNMYLHILILSMCCLNLGTNASLSFHSEMDVPTDTCGYQSCNPVKEGQVNVHLVPHTHDDPGWLKSVDQYYYGSDDNVVIRGVQYILDSVIDSLLKDPSRRFIYVEVIHFTRWWNEQTPDMQETVKKLVNEGRLEFIHGAWCMADEASPYYSAVIDDHTLGFEFLQDTFGDCGRARVAWQIDPFGHSKELAYLFAQMGYDGLFFGRIDYQDRKVRANRKTLEVLWQAGQDLDPSSDLFTGAFYPQGGGDYGPPADFCWDIYCPDEPIMDDPRLHGYNVKERVQQFLHYVDEKANYFATNHIMMTMGNDFNYGNANKWFKNMDKLIKYTNALQSNGSRVNLLYSTPSCYLYQLYLANQTWPTKQDDYFPYADAPHTFWTGYFTTRPTHKKYARDAGAFLQVCKQLPILAALPRNKTSANIDTLRKSVSLMQDHDCLTGCEKQVVAYDYAMRLANGVAHCQETVSNAYRMILPLKTVTSVPTLFYCNLLNISMCNITDSNTQFVVILYNSLGHAINHWIRLPVSFDGCNVTAPGGNNVPNMIIPIPPWTKLIPERNSPAMNELIFQASIPPLGFATFGVTQIKTKGVDQTVVTPFHHTPATPHEDITIENQFVSLTFDGRSGFLKQMSNLENNITLPLRQEYRYYVGYPGNNSEPEFHASGAFIFRPLFNTSLSIAGIVSCQVYKSTLVQEVWQTFSPWMHQVVRLYAGEKHAEFEWTVGPIPIEDGFGKEIITQFTSSLNTQKTFYTDSNGRQFLKRVLNYRPTWKLNQTEHIAGNYYPLSAMMYIEDESTQLTVITDRAQGGSSLMDGQMECMIHRRLLYDDAKGVNQALNELGVNGKGLIARGKHYLILNTVTKSASVYRDLSLRINLQPSYTFVRDVNFQTWKASYATQFSGLTHSLPLNAHILSLEQWRDDSYLLRLEHPFAKDEDSKWSQPVTVSLKNLFTQYNITSVIELTLGANQKLKDSHRLHWNGQGSQQTSSGVRLFYRPHQHEFSDLSSLDVTLKPMQIRTFQITTTHR